MGGGETGPWKAVLNLPIKKFEAFDFHSCTGHTILLPSSINGCECYYGSYKGQAALFHARFFVFHQWLL